MINIGQLDKRIAIQELTKVKDEDGYKTEKWVDVKSKLPAMVIELTGKEFVESRREVSEYTVRFVIRYRTGLNNKMRIVYDGREFNIQQIIPDRNRKQTMTIVGIEVV